MPQARLQLCNLVGGAVRYRERKLALKQVDDRHEGAIRRIGRATGLEIRVFASEGVLKGKHQARLSDPGVTADHRNLAYPFFRPIPALRQYCELVRASFKGRQSLVLEHFPRAESFAFGDRRIDTHEPRYALELMRPQITAHEMVLHQ